MGKTLVTDFLIYRWRYVIGYSLVLSAFVGLLIFAGLYVPGGLSSAEMTATAASVPLSFTDPVTLATPSVPFYLVQKALFQWLGVSHLSIKLLSLICAFIAGIGVVFLLRRWYRPNIAVLAAIIMITTGQFLFIAQSGTASILYIMWPVWLLLAATMITGSSRHKQLWKLLFFIIMALSLYTPLMAYLILAIASAAILHPHVRHVLRRMPQVHLVLLACLGIILLAPLGYLIALRPTLAWELLGIPTAWPPDIMTNIGQLIQQYLNFVSPQSGVLMTPVLGLGSIVLIAIGGWQLFKTRYTARSYTMTAWTILLIPILIINPRYTSITFVPLLLLTASGLTFLLRSWYSMFPLNPYARIAGLIPLIVLVAGLVISGVDRYIYGYHYDPNTATSFSRDLTLLQHIRNDDLPIRLVVTPSEKPFYQAVAHYNRGADITVISTIPRDSSFVITRAAHTTTPKTATITRIVTTERSHDADRFYVYKRTEK
ncbi:MAG: glycosyltransferase family 39 protein [Candidatus Saccharimonadales bacterium]